MNAVAHPAGTRYRPGGSPATTRRRPGRCPEARHLAAGCPPGFCRVQTGQPPAVPRPSRPRPAPVRGPSRSRGCPWPWTPSGRPADGGWTASGRGAAGAGPTLWRPRRQTSLKEFCHGPPAVGAWSWLISTPGAAICRTGVAGGVTRGVTTVTMQVRPVTTPGQQGGRRATDRHPDTALVHPGISPGQRPDMGRTAPGRDPGRVHPLSGFLSGVYIGANYLLSLPLQAAKPQVSDCYPTATGPLKDHPIAGV